MEKMRVDMQIANHPCLLLATHPSLLLLCDQVLATRAKARATNAFCYVQN